MLIGVPVELSVQTRRIKCCDCGIKTESLSWLEPSARITKRLKSYIEQLPLHDERSGFPRKAAMKLKKGPFGSFSNTLN